MVSRRKTHPNREAVDCILCDVPVCIAAGFSPEEKKLEAETVVVVCIICGS